MVPINAQTVFVHKSDCLIMCFNTFGQNAAIFSRFDCPTCLMYLMLFPVSDGRSGTETGQCPIG